MVVLFFWVVICVDLKVDTNILEGLTASPHNVTAQKTNCNIEGYSNSVHLGELHFQSEGITGTEDV